MNKKASLFCILMLFCFAIGLKAQMNTFAVFNYDDDGNRISVNYIMTRVDYKEISDESSSIDLDIADDMSLSVYPNPTTGYLVLASNSSDSAPSLNVKLLSLNGTIVEERHVISDCTEFDLTQQPAGIYFLSIELNGEKQLWKIIKR